MENIGITGYKGKLGTYLLNHYDGYVPLDCDVTIPEQIEQAIQSSKADFILHLAAKSDVEWCEKPENEKIVSNVNLRGTFNVCRSAQLAGLNVMMISTDHVFDGFWGKYKENSKPGPKNSYGRSKLTAESLRMVFSNLKIVRTSYLFDADRMANRLSNMWIAAPELYPTFILRSFMYLPHFAKSLTKYLWQERYADILHISSNDIVSW